MSGREAIWIKRQEIEIYITSNYVPTNVYEMYKYSPGGLIANFVDK